LQAIDDVRRTAPAPPEPAGAEAARPPRAAAAERLLELLALLLREELREPAIDILLQLVQLLLLVVRQLQPVPLERRQHLAGLGRAAEPAGAEAARAATPAPTERLFELLGLLLGKELPELAVD